MLVSPSRAAELFGNASVNLPVGQDPSGIVVADLNGDGQVDLAVTNRGSDSVSILLGDGLGAFSPTSDIDVGVGPEAVAVADFNADGHMDLAVVNRDAGSASILLGNGDGTFTRVEPDVLVGEGPEAIAAGDLDGDGLPDLAVANRDADSVSILLGNGSGGFLRIEPDIGEIPGPAAVAVGDLDGDGLLDVAVASSSSNSVIILLGNIAGGFKPQPPLPVGRSPASIVVGDFNGDGLPDLAAVNEAGGTVTVLLRVEEGDYFRQPDLEVGDAPVSVHLGDFDSDGHTDLAVADLAGDSVTVLFNRLPDRADVNGSRQIDGFDLAAIGLRSGVGRSCSESKTQSCSEDAECPSGQTCDDAYRRNVDVDLDGLIDGSDLTWAAMRFGDFLASAPLAAHVVSDPPLPDTVSFQQVAHAGDLLRAKNVLDIAARHQREIGGRPVVELVDTDTPGPA